jgi:hypothetical protein
LVTAPAVTEPVLAPLQVASVLEEAAKANGLAGCPMVTELD